MSSLNFFTVLGSNGAPNNPNSLHYMGPTPTLYEQALLSVVTIIQDYDSDKHFPVLGFGAKVPPNGILSHEFFVNLTPNPHCFGVNGKICPTTIISFIFYSYKLFEKKKNKTN